MERILNTKPKNVIFILIDDHRFDFMGFTGKVPWLETPNLDRMAKEGAYQMQGRSIMPILKGEDVQWRDRIFYEYYWENDFPQTPTMHGVRTDRYKLIRYHGVWDTNEFYDLQVIFVNKNRKVMTKFHTAVQLVRKYRNPLRCLSSTMVYLFLLVCYQCL